MAKKEGVNKTINKPYKGLNLDNSKSDIPEGHYTYALNATVESSSGDLLNIGTEEGNELFAALPSGYILLGKVYIGNGDFALFSINPSFDTSAIGILNKTGDYQVYLQNYRDLGFKATHPIDATFRLRRNGERMVYFTDNLNKPRVINLNDPSSFKDDDGNFDVDKLTLIKDTNMIPRFSSIDISERGNLQPGSYNIGIAYEDEDNVPTQVLSVSQVINIYNDNYSDTYEEIGGSTALQGGMYQYASSNKAIHIELSNLDTSYTYYRLYLIEANTGNGQIAKVSYTNPISLDTKVFELTGDNTPNTSSVDEVLQEKIFIHSAEHIEQLESRLMLGNIKGPQKDLYNLQKYATRIKADLALTEDVTLNDINTNGNPKRCTIDSEIVGYMPGEVYAFGIVYVFEDGYLSPVYHIPGKSDSTDSEMISNLDSNTLKASTNTLQNTTYSEDDAYWGEDCEGNSVAGSSVRHHRFPFRSDIGEDLYTTESEKPSGLADIYLHDAKAVIAGQTNKSFRDSLIYVQLRYDNKETGAKDQILNTVIDNPAYRNAGDIKIVKNAGTVYASTPNIINCLTLETQEKFYVFHDDGGIKGQTSYEDDIFFVDVYTDSTKTTLLSEPSTRMNRVTVSNFTIELDTPLNISEDYKDLYVEITYEDTEISLEYMYTEITISQVSNTDPEDHIYLYSYCDQHSYPCGGKTRFCESNEYKNTLNSSACSDVSSDEIPIGHGLAGQRTRPYTPSQVCGDESFIYLKESSEWISNGVVVQGGNIIRGIKEYEIGNKLVIGAEVDFTYNGSAVFPSGTTIVSMSDEGLYGPYIIVSKPALQTTPWGGANGFSVNYNQSVESTNTKFKYKPFGITFSNIDMPDDTVGYYIVRMERKDSDKTILDSAIASPLMVKEGFTAFGQYAPKDVITDVEYFAITTPEHKFKDSTITPSEVIQEGTYNIGTRYLVEDIVQDVYAGTSYNPETAKLRESDSDGFDLHYGVRYNTLTFDKTAASVSRDVPDSFYLNTGNSTIKDDKLIYNASSDNKIGIIKTSTTLDTDDKIPYLILKKDIQDPYVDYRSTPYYKEHTNIVYATGDNNTKTVYHGDSYLSPMTLTNTLFQEAKTRNRDANSILLFNIGLANVVGGVIASIFTGGALKSMVELGISQMRGAHELNSMHKTYQEDYEKGLKKTIRDSDSTTMFAGNPQDDEMQYFADILGNVWFETSINTHQRLESNADLNLSLPSPSSFNIERVKTYMLNKLTIIDGENEGGRLLIQTPLPEVYNLNPDYLRKNKESLFFHLPTTYSYLDSNEEFPHRVHWSEQSFQEEAADNFRSFLANNYRDVNGNTGKITNLFAMRDNLYIHCDNALYHLPSNLQERVTDDLVSYIGTGDFFSVAPRPIIEDDGGNGAGLQHKSGSILTPHGYFFVSAAQGSVYKFDGKNLENLNLTGVNQWMKKELPCAMETAYYHQFPEELFDNTKMEYFGKDNPANKDGVGYAMAYDSKYERVLLSKKDFLLTNAFFSEGNYILSSWKAVTYIFEDVSTILDEYSELGYSFVKMEEGKMKFINDSGNIQLKVGAPVTFNKLDNSWTLSFSLKTNSWTSMHSYLPYSYISGTDLLISLSQTISSNINKLWKHNVVTKFLNYYDIKKDFVVEVVNNIAPFQPKLYEYVDFETEAYSYDSDLDFWKSETYITFNKVLMYNTRQLSGELDLVTKESQLTDGASYMTNQIANYDNTQVTLNNNEGVWSFNNFRDYRSDYTVPMFNATPTARQTDYFTDKVLNPAAIDMSKDWTQLQSFRDKYLVLRYIFTTFDNIKLLFKFSVENEKPSIR